MSREWSAFLWIFQKIALSTSLRKAWKGREIQELLNNNKHHSRKRNPPPFFHSNTILVLGHVQLHSAGKTYVLGVTVESTWLLFLNILSLNFFPTPNKSLRFRRFRRSYVNFHVVVRTNPCHGCTALPFLLDVRCSK